MSYGLGMTNTSGRTLTNVTVAVTSAISSTLPVEARTFYLFLREWKNGESQGVHGALVDAFPPLDSPRPTTNCLTYSLWCDQLSQEEVVLDMWLPEPRKESFTPSRDAFCYAFHKQGEPQYNPKTPDLFVPGSMWKGRIQETKPGNGKLTITLVVAERNGKTFRAEVRNGTGKVVLRVVEGTIEKSAIKWQDGPKTPMGSRGQPTAGEINGTRIEALFAGTSVTRRPVEGFVTLERFEKK
jgi:hypothetical protein